jgi:long-chain acyl-CoA synthetase
MTYDDRPWLSQYPEGAPSDIEPEHPSALAMFRSTATAMPERPYLHWFGTTLTFADVDGISDQIACGLLDLGLRHGDRVALYLQNVPQFAVSVLAGWKCGAIIVPVNPMSRERELEHHLNDSGATILIALESLHDDVAAGVVGRTSVHHVITTSEATMIADDPRPTVVPEPRAERGHLDLAELCNANEGRRPPAVEIGATDIAFLTYTSGTTGPPKGAMNTHGNVVFNAQTYRDWLALTADDVILGVAPLFHITGLVAHLGVAMLCGASVVLGYRFDAGVMLELIERYRATFTIGSITVFIALMNDATLPGRDLSSLATVVSGGAPVPVSVVDEFERRIGPYIHNIYGMTETTSPSHCVPVGRRAPVDAASGALSVGVPIFNTVVRVVDDDGNDVSPGELGELVTAGPQVVPGYWNKPEETEMAMPDGAIRTGDIGYMDPDGWFFVVDRKKDMIVASGYKVWPREVEDVLYEHPAVREAAVIGVPDEYRGETVKAFVSLRRDASVEPEELIGFCKERMAAYKYPRQIELVDDLPKTVTGKILRRELRG